ncbi:MAG: zinc-binding dehydrogenase [Rhodothermales bacterium]
MMNVVRIHGADDLRLNQEPRPSPSGNEMLVRVTAVGICGSDLHWLEDGGIGAERIDWPLVLGHEFAGVVDTPDGERIVAVDPAIPCGACLHCRDGNPNLCQRVRFSGHPGDDGALREYMSWPSECLFPLPDGMTASDGAMLEPVGVAIHAVDLGKVLAGTSVGVFGCGPIGLLTLQVARAAGATTIVATDRLDHRLDAAVRLGADVIVKARGGAEAEEVLKAVPGGVDVAFEAAGTNEAVDAAVDSARPGARVVLVGIPSDDNTSFRASTVRRKGLTVMWARRMKHTYPRAIELVRTGRVDVRSLVTHTFPMTRYEEAFDVAVKRKGLKVVVEP